jgi:AMMECR1 domain-containing protein
MDDKLNLPTVIYDEILNTPIKVDVLEPIQEIKEGPPGKDGKDGPPGKTGKSVVDKATTATINQIKANQEIQNKHFKEIFDNFTNLFKKIEFIEKKLSEFE